MSIQNDLDVLLDEIASDIFEDNERNADALVDKIDAIRREINGILVDYSNKDGTISKHRLNTLMRELDRVESDMYEVFTEELDNILNTSLVESENRVMEALITVIGASILFRDKKDRPKSSDLIRDALDYVYERDIDGSSILERISATVGWVRDSLQREIRYGAHRGLTVGRISLRVKDAFDRASWVFRRTILTEIPIAYRKLVSTIGGKIGVIKGVKIIDEVGRRNHPDRHHYHECYRLAEQNPYGMGKGVYLPKDTYIFDPHPQCTAYFRFILNDEELSDDV